MSGGQNLASSLVGVWGLWDAGACASAAVATDDDDDEIATNELLNAATNW